MGAAVAVDCEGETTRGRSKHPHVAGHKTPKTSVVAGDIWVLQRPIKRIVAQSTDVILLTEFGSESAHTLAESPLKSVGQTHSKVVSPCTAYSMKIVGRVCNRRKMAESSAGKPVPSSLALLCSNRNVRRVPEF